MGKYAVLFLAVTGLAGCVTYDRSAAGGSTAATHDVRVQMDRDGSIQTFPTTFNLREGDRVRVQADGKVAPL